MRITDYGKEFDARFSRYSNICVLDFSMILTHFRLNSLSTLYIGIVQLQCKGMSGYVVKIFLEKNGNYLQTDYYQTSRSLASQLDLHCFTITLLEVFRLQWVNKTFYIFTTLLCSGVCFFVHLKFIKMVCLGMNSIHK